MGLEYSSIFAWFFPLCFLLIFSVSSLDFFSYFFFSNTYRIFHFFFKKYKLPRAFLQFSFFMGIIAFELNINIKSFRALFQLFLRPKLAYALAPWITSQPVRLNILNIKWCILILIFLKKFGSHSLDFYFCFGFFCQFVDLEIFNLAIQFNIW